MWTNQATKHTDIRQNPITHTWTIKSTAVKSRNMWADYMVQHHSRKNIKACMFTIEIVKQYKYNSKVG